MHDWVIVADLDGREHQEQFPLLQAHPAGSLLAGNSYRFVGLSQPHVSIQLKHYGFKTVAKGFRYVEFADGTRIDITYPAYCMKVSRDCPQPGILYPKPC